MANVMKNRLNIVLPAKTVEEIQQKIQEIIQLLPYGGTVTLEDQDRYSLSSLDVDNKAFVEDAIAEVKARGTGIIPAFITADMMQTDLTFYSQCDHILGYVNDLTQRLEDMRRIVASEAYSAAGVCYSIFDTAAQAGMPGAQAAYDKLKPRYKNKGTGAPPKTNE